MDCPANKKSWAQMYANAYDPGQRKARKIKKAMSAHIFFAHDLSVSGFAV